MRPQCPERPCQKTPVHQGPHWHVQEADDADEDEQVAEDEDETSETIFAKSTAKRRRAQSTSGAKRVCCRPCEEDHVGERLARAGRRCLGGESKHAIREQ